MQSLVLLSAVIAGVATAQVLPEVPPAEVVPEVTPQIPQVCSILNPCVKTPAADGLIAAIPFTSASDKSATSKAGNVYDWEPLNCQYNGLYHPSPGGFGGLCNSTYFSIAEDPTASFTSEIIDEGPFALRGRLYAGDVAKDFNDLEQQQLAGDGLRCPTTRLSSACNAKGQCDDYFPPGSEYSIQFDYMVTDYLDGFNHCFFNILGPNVALCYTDGSYWINNVNGNDNTNYKKLAPLTSPLTLKDDMNTWNTWLINYYQDANGDGFFKVSKDGVYIGEATLTMGTGTARRVEFGVYSVMPQCATANFEFYLKNVLIYKGTSIPSTYREALAEFTFPHPFRTESFKTQPLDMSLFAIYPTMDPNPTTTAPVTTVQTSEAPTITTSNNGAGVEVIAQQVSVSSSSPISFASVGVLAIVLMGTAVFARGH